MHLAACGIICSEYAHHIFCEWNGLKMKTISESTRDASVKVLGT